jgi:Arc/MetJ family transcription regulator
MRTTLTLDDDVAAQVERVRRERDASLEDVVNEALRRGLREMQPPKAKRERFRTKGFEGATLLIPVDNVFEAIAAAEGEDFK